ncbi:hypothetical protein [Phocoenobacter atlanticus]|uniref:hypothetical protein n=1 Tax=Phocoenobacter atlanticus TaxID=3416742 RepID=UPI0027603EAE|nr:hypothetical protein [Pasteurella atlantica]MDP8101479.1 hypothetical protein [Pasteurella atlantica]
MAKKEQLAKQLITELAKHIEQSKKIEKIMKELAKENNNNHTLGNSFDSNTFTLDVAI